MKRKIITKEHQTENNTNVGNEKTRKLNVSPIEEPSTKFTQKSQNTSIEVKTNQNQTIVVESVSLAGTEFVKTSINIPSRDFYTRGTIRKITDQDFEDIPNFSNKIEFLKSDNDSTDSESDN